MIYLMGDTHGDRERLKAPTTAQGMAPQAGDYLLISGDFGFIFANSEEEAAFLDELETRPYTVCFCDGNHENFPAIYA